MTILVVGASSTAIRLANELVRGGERVVALVLPDSQDWMLDYLGRSGATVRCVASIATMT